MTFTYNPPTLNDVNRVRFNIGDTDSTAVMITDEEINFRIAESGDWKHAVIDCLSSIIARLSMEGEFTEDWLTIRQDVALKNFQLLLKMKRQEFGILLISATTAYTYRPDNTNQTSAPTFDTVGDDQ